MVKVDINNAWRTLMNLMCWFGKHQFDRTGVCVDCRKLLVIEAEDNYVCRSAVEKLTDQTRAIALSPR